MRDAPSATDTLSVRAAEVHLGGRCVMGPVTLDVLPGLVHGIIGHNGSGKSTLLRLMARQVAPAAGSVRLGTEALDRFGARALARRVAYLPQQPPSDTGLTVRELVEHGRYPWHGALGRIGEADRQAVAAALTATELDGDADRSADDLSGGERQRAWIAMLIAQGAGILLLDEPTAALDVAHAMDVLATLRGLAHAGGAAVVLVLHDINMAARFCDRLVAMRGGTILVEGPPDAVMRPDALEAIYGLPMTVLNHGGPGPILGYPT